MIKNHELSPLANKKQPQGFALPFIDEHYSDRAHPALEQKKSVLKSKHETAPLLNPRRRKKAPAQSPTPSTPLRRFYKFSKQIIITLVDKLIDVFRHYASWMAYLPNVTSLAKVPQSVLRASQILAPSIRLINGLRLFYRSFFEKEKWTRLVNMIGGLANTGLAIASFIVPALAIAFITANIATNVALGLWFIGVALKNRIAGHWGNTLRNLKQDEEAFYGRLAANPRQFNSFKGFKRENPLSYQDDNNFELSDLENSIIEKRNQLIKLNADLTTKCYNTGILLIALSGIVMCFFPPTFLAGATLLLATAVHGFFLGYDLGGRLPQVIHRLFFKPRIPNTIVELERKVTLFRKAEKSLSTTSKLFKELPLPTPSLQSQAVSPTSKTKLSLSSSLSTQLSFSHPSLSLPRKVNGNDSKMDENDKKTLSPTSSATQGRSNRQ